MGPAGQPSSAEARRPWNERTRYRTLADSIDEGFCVVEMLFDDQGRAADYRFLEVNPSFGRQTGLVDPLGRRMRELAPAHEEFWFQTYGAVARGGESVRFEHRALALERVFDVFAFRVGAPRRHRVAILFSDISEKVQAREALALADRRKDEFMAVLAHELRGPLAPMTHALRILRLGAATAEATARALDILERQVAHMTALVEDLTDVGRIARGQVEVDRRLLDLARVAAQAVETAQPALDAAGQRLSVDWPAAPLQVLGNPRRLVQAIANLLFNAAKFTPRAGRVALAVRADGAQALVTVTDSGIGIAPEHLERVFGMFEQVRGERAGGSDSGLGIGLALVRQIVEMHGGTVRARSAGPGAGSRFEIRIPLAAPAQAPP